MPPKKIATKGTRNPKVNFGRNVPVKVAVAFFFLGTAVIILTMSLVGLIVSVKARFEALTASINSLTMKDEFQHEYERFILSRRSIERIFAERRKYLEVKMRNGHKRLDTYNELDKILLETEIGLQKLTANTTVRYAAYKKETHEKFKSYCSQLNSRSEELIQEVLTLSRKVEDLDFHLAETEKKMEDFEEYIRHLFPKNFQYYQLGGYPQPKELWSFLDWNNRFISHRVFIQISHDVNRFGQQIAGSNLANFESAFALNFIPAMAPESGYYHLKQMHNGTHNLKLNLARFNELVPKSRKITIWQLKDNSK